MTEVIDTEKVIGGVGIEFSRNLFYGSHQLLVEGESDEGPTSFNQIIL